MKKPTFKRQFIYYFGTLILMVLFISGYAWFDLIFNDVPFNDTWMRLWIIPFLVVFLLFAYELILSGIVFSKNPKRNEKNYVMHVSGVAKEVLELEVEDFEKLRDNEPFQNALKEIYQLFQKKRSKKENYQAVLDAFKKDSLEFNVVQVVIKETRYLLNEPV